MAVFRVSCVNRDCNVFSDSKALKIMNLFSGAVFLIFFSLPHFPHPTLQDKKTFEDEEG